MGILDEAIREHLELKRQHGASEQEIQQAQAEALGPARRDSTAEPFADEGGMAAPFEPVADDEPPSDLGHLRSPRSGAARDPGAGAACARLQRPAAVAGDLGRADGAGG